MRAPPDSSKTRSCRSWATCSRRSPTGSRSSPTSRARALSWCSCSAHRADRGGGLPSVRSDLLEGRFERLHYIGGVRRTLRFRAELKRLASGLAIAQVEHGLAEAVLVLVD